MEKYKFKVEDRVKIELGKDLGREVIIIERQPAFIYKTKDPKTGEILYYSEAFFQKYASA